MGEHRRATPTSAAGGSTTGPCCRYHTLVESWLANLAPSDRVSGEQLKERLTGLRSWHTDLGLDNSGTTGDSLKRLIRGDSRYHGERSKGQALPITLPVLRWVVDAIRSDHNLFGGTGSALSLTAAYTLAFAAFLRCANFTHRGGDFDPAFDLCRHHVHLETDTPYIHVPASKTDVFRQGVDVNLPTGIPDDLSPVNAIRELVAASQPNLWCHCSPSAVSTHASGLALREARIGAKFTGHSFRRGAATWAASVGCSESEIQAMGRWKSDCLKAYIDRVRTE